MINLWLDDDLRNRKPPSFIHCGLIWVWAKTADEAIEYLKTGTVEFASLDHDLADEHYFAYHGQVDPKDFKEKTGMSVLNWMEENAVWPKEGVRIHTMNPGKKLEMLEIINRAYGRTFQHQYKSTHQV